MQSSLYYNNSITPNYGPYNLTKEADRSSAYDYLSWKRSTIQNKQAQQNSNKIQPKKSNRPITKKNPDESIDSEQPFYSTWLFWVLLLILISIAVGIGFGAFKLQEYIEHQMKKNHMITSFSPVPNVGDFMVSAEVQPYGASSPNSQPEKKVSLTRVFQDTEKSQEIPLKQQSEANKDIKSKNEEKSKETEANSSQSKPALKNVQNQTKNKTQSSKNRTVSNNTTQPYLSTGLIPAKNTFSTVLPQTNTLPSPQTYPSQLPLPNQTFPSRYA